MNTYSDCVLKASTAADLCRMVDVMLGAIAADEKSSTLGGLYGIPAGRFVELYGAGLGLASLQKYRDGLVWVLEATPQEEETIIANSGPVDWARQENGERISFVWYIPSAPEKYRQSMRDQRRSGASAADQEKLSAALEGRKRKGK